VTGKFKRVGGTRALARKFAAVAFITGVVAAAMSVVPAVTAVAATNPTANLQLSANYNETCADAAVVTATCPAGLGSLNALRASEGVVPMSLPTDFASLTGPEQIFVVANLERVDRGLPPIQGLSVALNADAQAGANAHTDPPLPTYGTNAGGNWGEAANIFSTYQLWMYQDGWGGAATTNEACTSPTAPGCWAHRESVLGTYPSPSLMGAGITSAGSSQSVAEVFVGGDTRDAPYFTWPDVTPYLPVGVTDSSVNVSSLPGTSQVGSVELWASGESMNVGLSISGGNGIFSMTSSGCSIAVGRSCEAGINFRPPALGMYTATLTVSGPNTVQTIPLHGVASRGYRLVGADGGIFSFGGANFLGSTGGFHLNRPIVGMADDPATGGYWLVASDGGVFSFGAPFLGSTGGLPLHSPIIGLTATPDGGGYWLVASDGGVFSFGDATFFGSAAGQALNSAVVGLAATPDGSGYWLATANGGVFTFGDAAFYGSAGGFPLNRPIVGIAPTPNGGGYWLVASDGGVFDYGDATFHGSAGALSLNRPIVSLAVTPDGGGYWLVASDGGVFNYGDAGFYGSIGAMRLNSPVVGVAIGQPQS
jgi:hypothetical protein